MVTRTIIQSRMRLSLCAAKAAFRHRAWRVAASSTVHRWGAWNQLLTVPGEGLSSSLEHCNRTVSRSLCDVICAVTSFGWPGATAFKLFWPTQQNPAVLHLDTLDSNSLAVGCCIGCVGSVAAVRKHYLQNSAREQFLLLVQLHSILVYLDCLKPPCITLMTD